MNPNTKLRRPTAVSQRGDGGKGAWLVAIQRLRVAARAGLPNAAYRQPHGSFQGAVRPVGERTHGRRRIKYSGGNFSLLSNEVFLLGPYPGELAVYSFLKRYKNCKTQQCWPSVKTIGCAVGMSENTVCKYIRQLEERELIASEPTVVITKASGKRNGNAVHALADPGSA